MTVVQNPVYGVRGWLGIGPAVLLVKACCGQVSPGVTRGLVGKFGNMGVRFLVGCANGVDECLHEAVCECGCQHNTQVACAFLARVAQIRLKGLAARIVVRTGMTPERAFRQRT